jgi:hypothetical protein
MVVVAEYAKPPLHTQYRTSYQSCVSRFAWNTIHLATYAMAALLQMMIGGSAGAGRRVWIDRV